MLSSCVVFCMVLEPIGERYPNLKVRECQLLGNICSFIFKQMFNGWWPLSPTIPMLNLGPRSSLFLVGMAGSFLPLRKTFLTFLSKPIGETFPMIGKFLLTLLVKNKNALMQFSIRPRNMILRAKRVVRGKDGALWTDKLLLLANIDRFLVVPNCSHVKGQKLKAVTKASSLEDLLRCLILRC